MINSEYRNKNIILDGFPRFADQYEFLHSITSDDILFILVDVPHEQIENRARNRGRSDDNALNEKFKFWNEYTVPMIKQIIEDNDELYTISNGDNDNVYENVEKVCEILCRYLSQN
jgi:adenylate kinase family enzyme